MKTSTAVKGFSVLLLIAATSAYAGGDKNHNNNNGNKGDTTVTTDNSGDCRNDSCNTVTAEGGEGGDVTVNINTGGSAEGQSSPTTMSSTSEYNSTNKSSFFAFSTSFPNATGCMAGGQGGIRDGNVAGFLGFHRMDSNCWLDALAEAESNVDLRARLKCGASKFRNAVAFDQKRSERQAYCVEYVTKVWKAEIERERQVAQRCQVNDVCAYVNGELHHYIDDND